MIDVVSELLGRKTCTFIFQVRKNKFRDQLEVSYLDLKFILTTFVAIKNQGHL